MFNVMHALCSRTCIITVVSLLSTDCRMSDPSTSVLCMYVFKGGRLVDSRQMCHTPCGRARYDRTSLDRHLSTVLTVHSSRSQTVLYEQCRLTVLFVVNTQ